MPAQPPNNPNQMSLMGQGPQHPGQIDISLSLLGSDSRDVLKAFTEQVGGLNGSLQNIVDQQRKILEALNQIVPSVGSGGPGAMDLAALPPRAPGPASSNLDSASRVTTGIREAPETASSPWTIPGQGTSYVNTEGQPSQSGSTQRPPPVPREPPPNGPRFGRTSGPSGGPRGPRGDAALAGTGADDPGIYIPRIGEFNSQDILRQLQHVAGLGAGATQWLGKRASANASSAADMASSGDYSPFVTKVASMSAAASGAMAKALGPGRIGSIPMPGSIPNIPITGASGILNGMSGGLGILKNLAPYAGAFTQTTGIQLNPYSAIRQGTSMGLSQGGTTIGIGGLGIRIPGVSVGTGGISLSPAGHQALQNAGQALSYGLSPGGSASWMRGAQNNLQELGWSGSTQKNAGNAWGALQASGTYGGGAIGSGSTVAPIIDQMIRYGSSSLKDFTAVLKALPDAALAANMSVDASNQSLLQFAETAKSQGSTFTQGMINAAAIQMGTGMSAASQQQAMSNPLVSGVLAAQHNILPGMTNLLGAGQQIGAVASRAKQLSDEITQQRIAAGNNPTLAREQGDQFAAQMLGLTAQQVKVYRTVGVQKITAMTTLGADAITARKSIEEIQKSNLLKAELQKQGRAGNVGIHGSAYMGNGKWESNEQLQTAAKEAALRPLYNEAKKAGLKGSEWTKIFGTGAKPASPEDVTTNLQRWIKNKTDGNTINSGGGGTIELSKQAQQWFKLKTGTNWKDYSNAGTESANTPAATMPQPSAVYGGGTTSGGAGPIH
jgi:hypothetical protein